MLPVSVLNTIAHNLVVQKTVVKKLIFSELKIEKLIFFTQSPTNVFCISVFNVGGCSASCLTLRPILMFFDFKLSSAWLLIKKYGVKIVSPRCVD